MHRYTTSLLIVVCFLLISVELTAQNVGVSTTSPQAPLHVVQPSGVQLNSADPIIFGQYTAGNSQDVIAVKGYSKPVDYYGIGGSFEGGYHGVQGYVNPTGGNYYSGVLGVVNGGSGTNYGVSGTAMNSTGTNFGLYGTASGANATNYGMYGNASGGATNWAGYFASGNVYMQNKLGIGQSAPSWPIDMSATQAVIRMSSTTSVNGSVLELRNTVVSPTFLGAINFNNSGNTYPGQIAYTADNKLKFRTAGIEQMYIDQYGNLNIGTSTLLGVKLNVDGGVGKFDDGVVAYDYNAGSENIAVFGSAGGATVNNWAGYFPNGSVYIADELRIGTTEPATGYKVSVDGKIICEELKVQLNANWPDYVFGEDYTLRSLYELQNEIQSLGHLPGMPSAAEVEKNGLETGEMQRLLLEKVEELTLYVIELKKENDDLKKVVQSMSQEKNQQ